MPSQSATTEDVQKQQIRFIVNPFSGVNRKQNIAARIQQHLDHHRFDFEICFTEAPGHATQLAREAAEKEIPIVVAVGGDGSVNEVAAGLLGSKTCLGILPGGSGNGFAMHLGIGRNIDKAIQLLNRATPVRIDTCQLNNHFYINLAGVGFDAWVAYQLKKSGFRGFFAYLRWGLLGVWKYQPKKYVLEIDGRRFEEEYLLIEVANAPMFGYYFEIAPKAKYNDGLLEVIVIKKAPKWRYLFSLWRFFTKSADRSSLVDRYTAKTVHIQSDQPIAAHTDGEGFIIDEHLTFSLNPLSLSVLAPPIFKNKNPI